MKVASQRNLETLNNAKECRKSVINITNHQGNAVGIHALAGKKITARREHDEVSEGAGCSEAGHL